MPIFHATEDQEIWTKAVGKLPVLSPTRPDIHSADTLRTSIIVSPAWNTRSPSDVSPSKSYRAMAWRLEGTQLVCDGLRGGLAVVGEEGLEEAPRGDVRDAEVSWDGWRGRLVGCADCRGGDSPLMSDTMLTNAVGNIPSRPSNEP